jgi:hypothetical protein
MRNRRPAALTAAIAICIVNSLGNLAAFGAPPIPRPVAYASLLLAVAGVFGAFGLWRLARWGALASAAVLALTALLAAPGVVIAPFPALRIVAVVTVTLDIAGILLLFLPASRRVYAVPPV